MAKLSKRLTVKGVISYNDEEKVIVEMDKDLGEIEHKFDDIFADFVDLDDVTLTLAHDKIIQCEDD